MKFFVLLMLLSNAVWSQDLRSHRWQERVIILTSDNSNKDLLNHQFEEFEQHKDQLLERKLVVYKCVDQTCVYDNFKDVPKTIQIKDLFNSYGFQLIGLDGGIKLKSDKFIEVNSLFILIDGMPMRRQELITKQKKND